MDQPRSIIAGGIIGALLTLASMKFLGSSRKNTQPSKADQEENKETVKKDTNLVAHSTVLLGDVGGTNVRLILRKIYIKDRTRGETLKELIQDSRSVHSFEEALKNFLKDIDRDSPSWPKVGVVGIAGPCMNNIVELTNSNWPPADGKAISQEFGMDRFQFINDFEAAGYGILNLQEKDYIRLNDAEQIEGGVKAVIGPGTGLGQGFLTKSKHAPYYEVYPAEGGHSEYSPRNQEDFELLEFAKEYIEKSDNIENLRAKGHVKRISIERLCAGPAVPLIYDFMRQKYKDLPRILEDQENIPFQQLTSKQIIDHGLINNDPLCMKVVEKFAEIYAVETGNLALKLLPYGGIYLIGGVTHGIMDYIIHNEHFIQTFYQKGRMEPKVRRIPIFLVKNETQVGILGSEEYAFRLLKDVIEEDLAKL